MRGALLITTVCVQLGGATVGCTVRLVRTKDPCPPVHTGRGSSFLSHRTVNLTIVRWVDDLALVCVCLL